MNFKHLIFNFIKTIYFILITKIDYKMIIFYYIESILWYFFFMQLHPSKTISIPENKNKIKITLYVV
jgi:hypothetical protein